MTEASDSILLVSREPHETTALRSFLAGSGVAVHVTTGHGAIQALTLRSYGLVIMDIGLPGIDGLALVRRALELDQDTRVLLIAQPGSTGLVIEALRLGAFDYVAAPLLPKELERKLRRIREPEPFELDEATLVAESQAMRTVISRAARASSVELPVFLHGELGTGRKTVARAIHRFGATRTEPFLTLNLKTIPAHLMASELFGSRPSPEEEGSHTGVLGAAGHGAVFLDNLDAMSSTVQLKLLGALDTKMIHPLGPSLNARLFCTSEKDLDVLVSQGIFQSGLHHRLSPLRISIPSLRERPEDIPPLARRFLERYAEESGEPVPGIAPEALATLLHYAWPGNVRELKNVMERAFVLAKDSILLQHLPPSVSSMTVPLPPKPQPGATE